MGAENMHVYRPTPLAGVVIGVLVFAGIALPGLVLAPEEYLAHDGVATLVVCGLCAFGLVLLGLLRTDCVVDREARTLTLTRVAWPRAPIVRVIPLGSIDRVEAQRRGRAARVVIVLADGEVVPLARGASSGDQHDATVIALNRMLGRAG